MFKKLKLSLKNFKKFQVLKTSKIEMLLDMVEDKQWCQNEFKEIFEIISKHKIVPQVDRIFSINQVNQAFTRISERKNVGKVLLSCLD